MISHYLMAHVTSDVNPSRDYTRTKRYSGNGVENTGLLALTRTAVTKRYSGNGVENTGLLALLERKSECYSRLYTDVVVGNKFSVFIVLVAVTGIPYK